MPPRSYIDRWWWLIAFLAVSLGVHLVIGLSSKKLPGTALTLGSGAEIEVQLEPTKPEPTPAPKPEPKKPEPKPKVEKPKPKIVAKQPNRKLVAKKAPRAPLPAPKPTRMAAAKPAPEPKVKTDEAVPKQPKKEPGGLDPKAELKPIANGNPNGSRKIQRTRMARTLPTERPDTPTPLTLQPDAPKDHADPGVLDTKPRNRAQSSLPQDNPLQGTGPAGPELKPEFAATPGKDTGRRISADRPKTLAGGGSPSPAPISRGKDGLRGPEQPDDLVYNGGGAGGAKLPKERARLGGGGGASVLSATNPLAKEVVADDRPGIGPGKGGGGGAGSGGGTGFSRGQGVGTDPNGRVALGTLRSKLGKGIGAGSGNGIGTVPPGGGRGTGSDLPGTGGNGFGYGRGNGNGVGEGGGPGIGGGLGGKRLARGGGNGDGGSGTGGGGGGRMALNRGIPFGDVLGLLRGSPNGGGGVGGGPGGPGKGTVFGKEGGGGSRAVHIVYVLDTSGSMEQGNKIGKALFQLKPGDSFNIVTFDGNVRAFDSGMQPATAENLARGGDYVDGIRTAPGTNISGAMERALQADQITHVFLLSDGEPSRGIVRFEELRAFIRDHNAAKAAITTLALGLGEDFPGIPLLKAIAGDNGGQFSYVNLAK